MTGQGLSLSKAGQLAGVSHDALYYKPKPRFVVPKPENVALVKEWCFAKPTYGYRRITAMIRRSNVRINRKQVHRIMELNNWLLPFHKRYRQRTGKTLPSPTGPDQHWQADFIQLHCGVDEKAYLFNVLDCFDRCWVGYNLSQTCMTSDNEPAVSMALEKRAPTTMRIPGLVFQSDNGSQYISNRFEAFLKQSGFVHETIRKSTPEDNAFIESLHSTLRIDYALCEFESFQQAQQAVRYAHTDYNDERIHSSLGYKTPSEFHEEMLKKVSLQNQ